MLAPAGRSLVQIHSGLGPRCRKRQITMAWTPGSRLQTLCPRTGLFSIQEGTFFVADDRYYRVGGPSHERQQCKVGLQSNRKVRRGRGTATATSGPDDAPAGTTQQKAAVNIGPKKETPESQTNNADALNCCCPRC